jgi:hypothetical protein
VEHRIAGNVRVLHLSQAQTAAPPTHDGSEHAGLLRCATRSVALLLAFMTEMCVSGGQQVQLAAAVVAVIHSSMMSTDWLHKQTGSVHSTCEPVVTIRSLFGSMLSISSI